MKQNFQEFQKSKRICVSKLSKTTQNLIMNYKTLLLLVIIFIASSCSKDDDTPIVPPVVNKYRLVEDSIEETKFIYNTQGQLVKETDLAGLEKCTYTYNAVNQLSTYNFKDANNKKITQTFTYNANSTVKEKVIEYKNLMNLLLETKKHTYSYNADNLLTTIKGYTLDGITNSFEDETILFTYTYDAQKRLIKNNEGGTYSYDSNFNVIMISGISIGIPYTNQFTYDDKKNPYYNLRPVIDPNYEIINDKNIKTSISTGTFGRNITYTYEYNDGGYPTKKTSLDGTVIYKYEKIN